MKRILMTTAIAALAASPVLADTETSTDTDAQVTESTDMSQEASSGAGNDVVADMEGMQVRASELIGKSVYILGEGAEAEIAEEANEPSDDWERVGEIGDVIISGEGEIESVTLDAGGFLGINEKHVSASLDELKFVSDSSGDAEADEERDYFVVFTGDKTALEDREEMDQAAVRDSGSSFFNDERDTAAADMDESTTEGDTNLSEQAANDNAEAETEMADSDSADMTEEQDSEQMAETDAAESEDTDLTSQQMSENNEGADATQNMGGETAALSTDERGQLTAEDLEGVSVYGTEEDRLGEISDLVLSDDGKITEVIVDVGGFLGIGEKPVALPFEDIELRRSDESAMTGGLRASVGYTSEELEGMDSWEN
ncbi:hypothetical protein A3731_05765 [Roseovarius sp. HI0049]|nr:hypothetical protein A3731_05765 [Roseovarius sp. HI0049]